MNLLYFLLLFVPALKFEHCRNNLIEATSKLVIQNMQALDEASKYARTSSEALNLLSKNFIK